MVEIGSTVLVLVSALLTFLGVRYAAGPQRKGYLGAALFCFVLSIFAFAADSGFWPRLYTLSSIYFLACIALPWLDLLRTRNAR
ncbi:MAG: hypothetical protein AAGL66_01100 [Pseudomonadota bacterium]